MLAETVFPGMVGARLTTAMQFNWLKSEVFKAVQRPPLEPALGVVNRRNFDHFFVVSETRRRRPG